MVLLAGCGQNAVRPLVNYERSSSLEIKSYKIFLDVIYNPDANSEIILDLELLDEAQGRYLIQNPDEIAVKMLIEKGFSVYQNEKGEIIADI